MREPGTAPLARALRRSAMATARVVSVLIRQHLDPDWKSAAPMGESLPTVLA